MAKQKTETQVGMNYTSDDLQAAACRSTKKSAERRGTWTDEQAAEYVGLSVKTMRKMRLEHRGPAYLKLGRSCRYLQADLDAWLESSRIDPAA